MEQKHPSHGLISASRVRGGEFHLFGSRLTHNDTIEIRVHEGESDRSLKEDRYLAGRELVSVRLTEVQWASLICSLNIGCGVPCTLERIGSRKFDRCPPPEDSIRQHTQENRETLDKALSGLKRLADQLGEELEPGKSPSKKSLGQIKREMDILLGNLPSNFEYSHQMFEEHVDAIVAEARASVEAHVTSVVMSLGIETANNLLPERFGKLQISAKSADEPVTDGEIVVTASTCSSSCQSQCQVACQGGSQ